MQRAAFVDDNLIALDPLGALTATEDVHDDQIAVQGRSQ